MTPPSQPNEPLDPTDDAVADMWLAGQHRNMGTDLASILDLDTGLHEILLAGQHRNMGTDLASTLDLDAGLAAILPQHKRHLPPPTQFNDLADLLEWLSAVPMVRLAHRTHLRLLAIDTEILHLTSTRAIARARDRARDHARDHARDRDPNRTSERILELLLELDQVRDRANELDVVLARNCISLDVLNHATAFDNAFNSALKSAFALHRAFDRASALDQVLNKDHGLVRDGVYGVARDLVQVRDRFRVRLRNVDAVLVRAAFPDLNRIHDQAYELAHMLFGMWVRFEVGNLLCAISDRPLADTSWLDRATIGSRETNRLNELAIDFTGVDLREVSLSGLDLIGVRWSRTTLWPPADVRWIVAASEPVGNGVYVVRAADANGGAMVVVPDPVTL